MSRIALSICVAALVAGCVSKPVNPIASLSSEEKAALKAKTEVPTGFSTVQFKDFGETKRNAALSSLNCQVDAQSRPPADQRDKRSVQR